MSTARWVSTFNATNWRISTFNGALLAAYFVPTWAIVACRIAASPVQGFYERPNISVALYLGDTLHVAADLTRFAWLLALGRLTVVAFFAVFLVQVTRRDEPSSGNVRLDTLLVPDAIWVPTPGAP